MSETITFDGSFAGWQGAARGAWQRGARPGDIVWQTASRDQPSLNFGQEPEIPTAEESAVATPLRVPRQFMAIARTVACHRDERRWSLLYRALWRLTHGEPHLFGNTVDPDVIALGEMTKAVRRDLHKMRAFVRFREITTAGDPWFVAWFEPHHLIVEANAPFFVDRFTPMNWSILTPDLCAHWDRTRLHFTPGATRDQAPPDDAHEDLWRTYYANIFNPARVKVNAMKKEMPVHYWKNLPEAALIPELLAEAPERTRRMIAKSRQRPSRDS